MSTIISVSALAFCALFFIGEAVGYGVRGAAIRAAVVTALFVAIGVFAYFTDKVS